jgi:hypothetical protein
MIKTFKSRLKACGIHFFLSALAFLIVLYFIVFLWYPNPHFSTSGGWQGVRIMLILYSPWPFLTLLIFNPEKSMKATLFDFIVIGTIQISAFIWGLSAIYSQRPVVINFWEGRFYPVIMEDLLKRDVKIEQINKLSHQSPAIIYSQKKSEESEDETEVVMFGAYIFSPLEKHIDALFEASLTNSNTTVDKFKINKLRNDKFQTNKIRWLEKTGMNEKEVTFIPYRGRYGKSIFILDRKGMLLDSISAE